MSKNKCAALFLALALCLTLTACGRLSNPPEPSPTPSGPTETLDVAQFDALLAEQPLSIESTSYVVQDDLYKALYPDMLQATLRNNTEFTIKKALVAFAAWDINGSPVPIEAKHDFIRGFYVREVIFKDIQLPPGETFGEGYGFKVEESSHISRIKAIAVSYEADTGETWENPYYEEWLELYEGVGFSEHMTVEVPVRQS